MRKSLQLAAQPQACAKLGRQGADGVNRDRADARALTFTLAARAVDDRDEMPGFVFAVAFSGHGQCRNQRRRMG